MCFEYELHIEKQEGEDFLFLFDLLAHTSGSKINNNNNIINNVYTDIDNLMYSVEF